MASLEVPLESKIVMMSWKFASPSLIPDSFIAISQGTLEAHSVFDASLKEKMHVKRRKAVGASRKIDPKRLIRKSRHAVGKQANNVNRPKFSEKKGLRVMVF